MRAALGTQPRSVTRTSPGVSSRSTGFGGPVCVLVTLVGTVWKPPAWLGLGEGNTVAGMWAQDPQPSFAYMQSREISICEQLKFLHGDLCPQPGSVPTAADKCRCSALLLPELWDSLGCGQPGDWVLPPHPGTSSSVHNKQEPPPNSPREDRDSWPPATSQCPQCPLPTLLPAPVADPALQERLSCCRGSAESAGR